MKTKELIERLQQCDPDARVGLEFVEGENVIISEVEEIETDNMGRVRVVLKGEE